MSGPKRYGAEKVRYLVYRYRMVSPDSKVYRCCLGGMKLTSEGEGRKKRKVDATTGFRLLRGLAKNMDDGKFDGTSLTPYVSVCTYVG